MNSAPTDSQPLHTHLTLAVERSGKSVERVAREIGLTAGALQQILEGRQQLPGMIVDRVARALGLDTVALARKYIETYSPETLEQFDAIPEDWLRGRPFRH